VTTQTTQDYRNFLKKTEKFSRWTGSEDHIIMQWSRQEHLRKIKRTCELMAGLKKLMDSISDTWTNSYLLIIQRLKQKKIKLTVEDSIPLLRQDTPLIMSIYNYVEWTFVGANWHKDIDERKSPWNRHRKLKKSRKVTKRLEEEAQIQTERKIHFKKKMTLWTKISCTEK